MTKQQTGVCERCNGPILEAGQKQHGLSRECIEYLEDELCEPALQKGLSIRREVSKARSEPLRYVDVFIGCEARGRPDEGALWWYRDDPMPLFKGMKRYRVEEVSD